MNKFRTMVLLYTLALSGSVMNRKVRVAVYYQTLSLECDKFITQQLYPTYMSMNEVGEPLRMSVQLVPYGNMKQQQLPDGSWTIEYRKKSGQPYNHVCVYNKFHACAIQLANDEWRSLNFINCLLTMKNHHHSAQKCAEKTCFEDMGMATCVNTADGDELLVRHGKETQALNVSLANLPVVTFDGLYEEEEQGRARENLLSLVCEKINTYVCSSPRAKRAMTHENFGTNIYYPNKIVCEYF